MLFNKHKKEEEERLKELERQRLQKEEERKQKLKQEEEAAKRLEAEKERAKPNPYKFHEPDPKPKELLSVLASMLKKLFPETKKAYLTVMSYEDKSGYLLICDIAPKFLKIIKLYLDGETKMVRNGMPIDCILYSKSGSITDSMKPFYVKAELEHGSSSKAISEKIKAELSSNAAEGKMDDAPIFGEMPEFDFDSVKSQPNGFDLKQIEEEKEELINEIEEMNIESDAEIQKDEEESEIEAETEEEIVSEFESDETEATEAQIPYDEENENTEESDAQNEADPAKDNAETDSDKAVEPDKNDKGEKGEKNEDNSESRCIDKPTLFAAINRSGLSENETEKNECAVLFAEYMFYIPIQSDDDGQKAIMLSDVLLNVPEGKIIKVVPLINKESGIKAIPMFTEFENARDFAAKSSSELICMKYKDYKANVANEKILIPSVEGVVINPTGENITLPPDCPLL